MLKELPELPEFYLDPFWLERQRGIRKTKEAIERPQTKVGKETCEDALNNPVFKVFDRIHLIFGSLISVLEYEQIGGRRKEEYFYGPKRQRMILRALGLLIEDSIKSPYHPNENVKYEDHHKFLENILGKFRAIDSQIQQGRKLPNFVNSLFMIFIQEVNNLRGVENFNVGIEGIRKEIAGYLPQLEKMEEGRLVKTILDKMPSEQPLEAKTVQ